MPRVFLGANILIRGVTLPRFPYEVLQHAVMGWTSEALLAIERRTWADLEGPFWSPVERR